MVSTADGGGLQLFCLKLSHLFENSHICLRTLNLITDHNGGPKRASLVVFNTAPNRVDPVGGKPAEFYSVKMLQSDVNIFYSDNNSSLL